MMEAFTFLWYAFAAFCIICFIATLPLLLVVKDRIEPLEKKVDALTELLTDNGFSTENKR